MCLPYNKAFNVSVLKVLYFYFRIDIIYNVFINFSNTFVFQVVFLNNGRNFAFELPWTRIYNIYKNFFLQGLNIYPWQSISLFIYLPPKIKNNQFGHLKQLYKIYVNFCMCNKRIHVNVFVNSRIWCIFELRIIIKTEDLCM